MAKSTSGNAESYIIGVNFDRDGKVTVMIVGKPDKGIAPQIINAFSGEEADELFRKLITKKEKNNA